jgi:hypothetical protein
MKKISGEFILTDSFKGTKQKIKFTDALCCNFDISFNKYAAEQLFFIVKLSAAKDNIELVDKVKENKKAETKSETVIVKSKDENPQAIECYFVNTNYEKIEETADEEKVFLVLKTANATGKEVTIDLSDKKHDFKYNGEPVTNKQLSGITLSNTEQYIELEVINPEKQ